METNRVVAIVAGCGSVMLGGAGLINYLIAASHAGSFDSAALYWGLSAAFLGLVLVGLYILGPILTAERGVQSSVDPEDEREGAA